MMKNKVAPFYLGHGVYAIYHIMVNKDVYNVKNNAYALAVPEAYNAKKWRFRRVKCEV